MKTPFVPWNAAARAAASSMSATAISQPFAAQDWPFSTLRTTARTVLIDGEQRAGHRSADLASYSSNCVHLRSP